MKVIVKIILLLLLLLSACVSTKPANNIKEAERRITKYNTGINNQLEVFPSLANKVYKVTEIITIEVPADSIKINVLLQDLKALNKIVDDYKYKYDSVNYKLTSIETYVGDNTVDLNQHRGEIKSLITRLKILNKENKELFKKYQDLSSLPQSGVFEDESFIVKYRFENGIFLMDVTSKQKEVSTEVDTQHFNIDIRKHFWQDIKFWGFLLILLNIVYFFNDLVYNFLQSIFTAIINFIRRLFIKI